HNFDIHVYYQPGARIAYQGIDGRALISVPIDGPGIDRSYVSTEIMSGQLNMGGMLNLGMFVNSWFQRMYYSYEHVNWVEWPATRTDLYIAYPGVTFGVGNNLYCDRPLRSWRGWGGYRSAVLYSMNLAPGRCD